MSHFAKVENGRVTQVIVAEQEFIDSGSMGDPSLWVQTSYNTFGGVHYGADGQPDGGVALRKNYAKIGGVYDKERDAFYDYCEYPTWILDENTCFWEPPVPYPNDGKQYLWLDVCKQWVPYPVTPTLDINVINKNL